MSELLYPVAELFAGAGGLGLAAKLASVVDQNGTVHRCATVWANDINPWACETYRTNLGGHVIEGKVQDLDIRLLPAIDGLMFGFPCNDYSVVGEHKGLQGDFGPLYTYGVRVLNVHRPRWFLAENVSGLETANEGEAFLRILDDLGAAGAGYNLTPHYYQFEDYGVPQTRHRIIVVGIRKDLERKFRVPRPTHEGAPITASMALAGSTDVPLNNELIKHSQKVVEMLRFIPPGGNAWSEAIPHELRLNVKGTRLSHIYRRLDPNLPAHTVTARGGGGTRGYHWAEPRALTNRELARLQTFPDNFHFQGPTQEVRAQIGMAVPPRGAKIIIEAILKTLLGIEYESVAPSYSTVQQRFDWTAPSEQEF